MRTWLAEMRSGVVAGLTAAVVLATVTTLSERRAASDPVRALTPRSVGLFGDDWVAFVQDAIPYTAAYNAVLLVTPSPSSPAS